MQTITLADTALTTSRLGFGTASLHHLADAAERKALLHAALDVGITHFDTSPYYGFGVAETSLAALAGTQISVATKVGLYPPGGADQSANMVLARKIAGKLFKGLSKPDADLSVARAEASLTDSLRRMKRDRVDLLLLHEPDFAMFKTEEWQRWLETEGSRIGQVGIAGEATHVLPFLAANDPVARLIQTRDSAAAHEAAPIEAAGRVPQITFGHLANRVSEGRPASQVLREALHARPASMALVSTRRRERLKELAAAVA